METVELSVEQRAQEGSSNARRLRNSGLIPAVIYGGDIGAKSVSVSSRVFTKETQGKPSSQMYAFTSEDKDLSGQLALIKNIQIDALKQTVMHIDFQAISLGKAMLVTVPLEVVGEVESVKLGLATLNQSIYEIEIECLPKSIPNLVQVDITDLELGTTLHASDLVLPEGVTLKTLGERSVVSILEKAEEKEEEPAVTDEVAVEAGSEEAPAADASGEENK